MALNNRQKVNYLFFKVSSYKHKTIRFVVLVKYTSAQSAISDFRFETDEKCISEDRNASVFRVVPKDGKLQGKLMP
jgi:hypothetical protein